MRRMPLDKEKTMSLCWEDKELENGPYSWAGLMLRAAAQLERERNQGIDSAAKDRAFQDDVRRG